MMTNGRRVELERWKIKRRRGNEGGECGGLRFRERLEKEEISVAVRTLI